MTISRHHKLPHGVTYAGILNRIFAESDAHLAIDTSQWTVDQRWMLEALSLAMSGVGFPSPNPLVGCILVRNGQNIGQGFTQAYGSKHAEVQAISDATTDDVRGATAYVTLEPCSHTGRTGPCVKALIDAGISRCVVAMQDPNPLVAGQGIAQLRAAGISVDVGVLSEIAEAWHLPFSIYITEKRPFVALKWAQTLDGCLCDDNKKSQWISGEKARRYTHWLRQKYDAVLVSGATYAYDKPSLTVRESFQGVRLRQPCKIIFDPSKRCKNMLFTADSDNRVIYFTTELKNPVVENYVLNMPLKHYASDEPGALQECLELLTSETVSEFLGKPLQSVLVEPGPKLLSTFMRLGNFDLAHCFINPAFLGSKFNSLSQHSEATSMEALRRFKATSSVGLGNDTLIEFISGQY